MNKIRRYVYLDGLRAIAILLVMMDHSYDFYSRYVPNYAHVLISPIYKYWGGKGDEGVAMFFMLSGFLITGVMIRDFSKEIELARFYIRRFLKIVPLFFVVVFLVYIISKFLGIYKEYSDWMYLTPLFFLQDFFHAHPIFSHAWSLTVEMEFYTLYPLITIAVFKFVKSPEERRWILLGIVLFLALIGTIYSQSYQKLGLPWVLLLNYCNGLFFGCALKLLEPYYPKYQPRLQTIFAMLCFLAVIIVLKFSAFMADGIVSLRNEGELCIYMIFTLLFFSAYYRLKPLNWFLENPLLCWIGRISYALYLWHYPLRYILIRIGPTPGYGFFSSLSCYWMVSIFLAALSTYTIERYFLNLRFKFDTSKRDRTLLTTTPN